MRGVSKSLLLEQSLLGTREGSIFDLHVRSTHAVRRVGGWRQDLVATPRFTGAQGFPRSMEEALMEASRGSVSKRWCESKAVRMLNSMGGRSRAGCFLVPDVQNGSPNHCGEVKCGR